jgi:hypothetical protein
MARVTHVKHAQQRYETIPVLDELEGGQKKVPVMRRDGTQKTTKSGRLSSSASPSDLSRPLPNRVTGAATRSRSAIPTSGSSPSPVRTAGT